MNIQKTIKALKENQIVGINTDTIPGLHAISCIDNAIKIVSLKKDKERLEKGFIHIGNSIEDFIDLIDISKISSNDLRIISIMRKNPITWILPANKILQYLTRKDKTVGIRIVADIELRAIIKGVGKCLISTSYNISGEKENIFNDIYYHNQEVKYNRQNSSIKKRI